jgi:hypothetical protein
MGVLPGRGKKSEQRPFEDGTGNARSATEDHHNQREEPCAASERREVWLA